MFSTSYSWLCPSCGRDNGHDPGFACTEGPARTLAIPYDEAWTFSPAFVKEATEHDSLRLMGRATTRDPELIRRLSHAKRLYLSRYPRFEMSLLEEFRQLEVLQLDYMRALGTLRGVDKIATLRCLGITECRALEDAEALSRCTAVRVLRLSLCPRLLNLEPVGGMVSLVRFDLEAAALPSVAFLRPLRELVALNLAVDKVNGDLALSLGTLPRLRRLGIRKRAARGQALETLRDRNPRVEIKVWP